jgi:hypothetical protein
MCCLVKTADCFVLWSLSHCPSRSVTRGASLVRSPRPVYCQNFFRHENTPRRVVEALILTSSSPGASARGTLVFLAYEDLKYSTMFLIRVLSVAGCCGG